MAELASEPAARLVLASQSPRRSDLLRSLGLEFEVEPADVDESRYDGEPAVDYVVRVARDKAMKVAARHPDALVVAADTTVALTPLEILAKPADEHDARSMLTMLSGRSHLVHTGVALARGPIVESEVETTTVRFNDIDEPTLDWYLATGEALDKAGGYAMQGYGGVFVQSIDGSPSNVVGLPLHVVVGLARRLGVDLARFRH